MPPQHVRYIEDRWPTVRAGVENCKHPLKEAIQRKFKRDNNLDYALEEIMVSNGSKQIMYDTLMASVCRSPDVAGR